MGVKRNMAFLLSGTALGVCVLAAAPAFAQEASNNPSKQQMQQEINSLQRQLDEMKSQQSQLPGLYDQAPPPMATKGPPSWFSGIHISLAGTFIEAATVWRQHNEVASGASDTPFSSMPFPNSALYDENEWRASAQQSRLAVKMSGDIDPTQHLAAYYEQDFLGAGVTANSRESNSYNLRVRQAWLSYDNDSYHFHTMAGQGWSMLTQNRVGIIPLYENVPLTIDAQYVTGFNWARQEQLRFVEDWNQIAWFGVSVESPQAAIGGHTPAPGTLVSGTPYPYINAANPCSASGLLDAATYCSNDIAPDFVEKFALDPGWGHYEVFGVERWFSDEISPFVPPLSWSQKVAFGWDVGGSVLVPAIPRYLDLQGSVMYGQGGGRYGSAQLADVTFNPDGTLHPLPYLGVMLGAVAHPWDGLDVYVYAGQEQVQNVAWGAGTDGYGNPLAGDAGCLVPGVPGAGGAVGTGFGGFGSNFNTPGGGLACTGDIQRTSELTVGFWQDAYKGAVGRVVFGVEYEYVQDHTFAGVGAPGGITFDNNIVFTSIRYYPF